LERNNGSKVKIVVVKNAKAGQKVKVKVEKVGNRYATATMAS
jgi:predicted RNA-binding protein with TRAM domain